MKLLRTMLAIAALVITAALPASAQFRFGPRIGTEVNSMRLNKSLFDNDNRAGFTGGLQMEFNVPVVNVGFDLSVMYVHRVSSSTADNTTANDANDAALNSSRLKNRDYIEIPLNFKYKIGLPLIGKVLHPTSSRAPASRSSHRNVLSPMCTRTRNSTLRGTSASVCSLYHTCRSPRPTVSA